MNRRLPWRLDDAPDAPFPPAESALRVPDGLLAIGGDLTPQRLLTAYSGGIFPWFNEGEPILWWSPDPRMVFRTDGVHLSRRFLRTLRGLPWTVSADTAFDEVMQACALAPRAGQQGTWITPTMRAAYGELYRLGFAHSVEVREGADLVGGIYGVCIGRMFFGESMFSVRSGGSKVALAALCRLLTAQGITLLDAQVENPHLLRMGAVHMPREAFLEHVRRAVKAGAADDAGKWAAGVPAAPLSTWLGG